MDVVHSREAVAVGLVILGLVFVALGGVMLLFPESTRRLGSKVLKIERARNVETDAAARSRQMVQIGLILVGIALVLIGLV